MRDFSFSGYGFLPFGKRESGKRELSLKEKLRAEFDEFDDGSTPVIHYQHKGQWYTKVGLKGSPQKLNMRGIQQHGRRWRVQRRIRGQLRKWTYDSLPEAQSKRDKLFG